MTVYVDDMYLYPMGRFGRMKMSHMITDQYLPDELHVMADTIGLNRKWYQGDHYDVSMEYRDRAIKAGATAITLRELGQITSKMRRHRAAARTMVFDVKMG